MKSWKMKTKKMKNEAEDAKKGEDKKTEKVKQKGEKAQEESESLLTKGNSILKYISCNFSYSLFHVLNTGFKNLFLNKSKKVEPTQSGQSQQSQAENSQNKVSLSVEISIAPIISVTLFCNTYTPFHVFNESVVFPGTRQQLLLLRHNL